jgi:aspartyl-tRNA synthetase
VKEPRANRYRSAWAGELRAGDEGREHRVAGWVHRRRDHGGLIFIDLRDRTGLLQVVFHPESAPEAHAAAHALRAEDVISVSGRIARREEGTVNPNLPTGEIELKVAELDELADAETPPFQVDDEGVVAEELRLRYRYLDLRRERMREAIELRSRVCAAIRDHLLAEDFLEIETPMLTRSTPEGARDYLVPSRVQRGSWYALPQSPQLFKQLFMVSGLERYFQIVRCFRDEDPRADRQPEFTQLDIEMSFVEEEDVHSLIDPLLRAVLAVGGVEVETPLPRMTYDDAVLRYGTDRPDRRPGMEIEDLSSVFAGSEFKAFAGAIEGGGVVRGFRASGGEWPRRRFDDLTEKAKSLGAKGLVWRSWRRAGRGARRSPSSSRRRRWERPSTRSAPPRATSCCSSPTTRRWPRRCSASCASTSPGRRRATTSSGSSTSRCSTGTTPRGASTRSTTRSPPQPATSTATRRPGGAGRTTS